MSRKDPNRTRIFKARARTNGRHRSLLRFLSEPDVEVEWTGPATATQILSVLRGRLAAATATGSEWTEALDDLVDHLEAAPALESFVLMYAQGGGRQVWSYLLGPSMKLVGQLHYEKDDRGWRLSRPPAGWRV